MKKYMLLLLLIFACGFLFIFTNDYLPGFNNKQSKKVENNNSNTNIAPYNTNQNTKVENTPVKEGYETANPDASISSSTPLASNKDTITVEEIPFEELEPELSSSDQIFFEGIENLYNILTFSQADEIMLRMEKYVKQSVNKDIKKCEVVAVKKDNDIVTLTLVMPDGKFIDVEVKMEYNTVSNVIFKQVTEIK